MEKLLLFNESQYFHCPYNQSHTMPHKTLTLHLTKCPDKPADFKSCVFNNLHVMPSKEIAAHEKSCPDRSSINEILYESENAKRPVTIINKEPTVVFEESWDDEPEESINVIKNIDKKTMLMKPSHGLTKSERKNHRHQICQKYAKVDLSYNANLSIGDRQERLKDGTKEKTLFFGKRP